MTTTTGIESEMRMANKLPDWLPDPVTEMKIPFERCETERSSTTLKRLLYYHFDDEGRTIGPTEMLMDEQGEDLYVMLRSDDIPCLSDADIVKIVRDSHDALRGAAAYKRITNFLARPEYYSNPKWSQAQLHFYFEECFLIGQSYLSRGGELWRAVIHQFNLYWTCENPEGGYVYCLHDQQGHYKLGITKKLDNRIRQLSTQPPFEITLEFAFKAPFARHYEGFLHNKFKDKRLRGEWFTLTAEDLDLIKRDAWFDSCASAVQIEPRRISESCSTPDPSEMKRGAEPPDSE